MSFSSHERNKANNIYVLGKDFIQGVTTIGPTSVGSSKSKGTTIYVETLYKHNFTEPNKKFVLSLHYNDDDSYLFVHGGEELKFKSSISHVDRSLTNSTQTGFFGNIYDFASDYVPISVGTIYDIHRCLMKKHDII